MKGGRKEGDRVEGRDEDKQGNMRAKKSQTQYLYNDH